MTFSWQGPCCCLTYTHHIPYSYSSVCVCQKRFEELCFLCRLSKHHLQHVLQCQTTGSRGHDLSLARQMLLFILYTGKKDQDLIQVCLTAFIKKKPVFSLNTVYFMYLDYTECSQLTVKILKFRTPENLL